MNRVKHFDVEQEGNITVIRLKDPQLYSTIVISELHDELLEFVETHCPSELLIDFETVTRCSTVVINSALRAKKRVVGTGGQLKLCGMHEKVRDAFQVLKLDGSVFDIYSTREEAIAAFQAEP